MSAVAIATVSLAILHWQLSYVSLSSSSERRGATEVFVVLLIVSSSRLLWYACCFVVVVVTIIITVVFAVGKNVILLSMNGTVAMGAARRFPGRCFGFGAERQFVCFSL